MYYQLQRLGMLSINQKGFKSQFGGSSKFRAGNNHVTLKKWGVNPYDEKRKIDVNKKPIIKDKKVNSYKLRKTKIRNKILNFFSLNASKKFCAFYSISFPVEISDEIAYQVLNTWLTRCRKTENLKSYLWIAERQKNNTLHFHLITNNYMRIIIVNEFMKQCLLTQYEKGNLNCKLQILHSYNGVDVDNLYNSKRSKNKRERLPKADTQRKLSYYLTKYISKNDVISNRLPWHCSRDISALFISINYSDASQNEISNLIADNPDAVTTYQNEFFTMHYFKFIPDDFYFNDLTEVNNLIYETFHPN
jgi:hypothetical protein